jgi:putative N6-adenine-specific DNA methylase
MLQKEKFELTASTLFGLENVLAEELKALGAEGIEVQNRAVKFLSDDELLYKANIQLRTALRVLKPIARFKARDQYALYKNIKRIKWEEFLNLHHTFLIKPVVFSPHFRHSKFAAQKTKDAIVDRFRERFNKRPSVALENPDIPINLHIAGENVTVSLDSSGAPLNQRGYRKSGGDAPLNEVLAAGMIKLSNWDAKSTFIDPMCGSGTLLIEAGMMALNIPPNINRNEFPFMNWQNFDRKLWKELTADVKSNILSTEQVKVKIIGSDINLQQLETTQKNVHKAGLNKLIKLRNKSFSEFIVPASKGILLFNPPYGQRLRLKQIEAFYAEIGNILKNKWTGFDAWILSCNDFANKSFGLKPAKKIKLFNGQLDCRFLNFPLFEGSRKDFLEEKKNKE